MKIERISENQIRCTLTRRDLMERQIKISELAYGSDKAKELFRDMMEQASIDFGFEADDIPLMIEAIPTTQDSIVLVITKVDNPEEFDEKFSRSGIHSDQVSETGEFTFDSDEDVSILDNPELSHCFQQLHDLMDEAAEVLEEDSVDEAEETESRDTDTDKGFVPLSESLTGKKNKKDKSKKESKKKKAENLGDRLRLFSFASLNPIIEVSHMALSDFDGKSTIWKDEKNARYYLMVRKGSSKTAFQRTCSIMLECGKEEILTYASEDFFNEHFTIIIKDHAFEQLSEI